MEPSPSAAEQVRNLQKMQCLKISPIYILRLEIRNEGYQNVKLTIWSLLRRVRKGMLPQLYRLRSFLALMK